MRYIPHTNEEIQAMLKSIGLKSVEELFSSIPESLLLQKPLKLPAALDEQTLLGQLESIAARNHTLPMNRSFLGGGVYRHYIPSTVSDLMRRSEFLTPYTPYQPEIAQGTLQLMFEFQTMVSEIYGMEVANSSLYDGSTALSEAILMAIRIGKNRKTVLMPESIHPEYTQVAKTILKTFDEHFVTLPITKEGTIERSSLNDYLNPDLTCCIIPYPNFFGIVEDVRDIVSMVHQAGGLVIFSVTEPLSLGLFESPGALGADIVCGEGQSLGLPPSFGGPFAGFFATKQAFLRQIPGRLCGMTTDNKGKPGFVLTLSTREQHIRREKATSNICTNQALCATQITLYLTLLGKEGFKKLAQLNWQRTEYAKQKLSAIPGVTLTFPTSTTFNEFVIQLPKNADVVLRDLRIKNFDGGISLDHWYPNLDNAVLVNVTEWNGKEDIDAFANALKGSIQ
ncbi:MAG: glycine dehydrogenase (aminomethyl-transferring) [Deltaproteobacteria bacterium RIFCSPLOWO2_02_FULL_46_8]|nr:MAG: glycine dehydrogenase (aminomethyl-transferring) [Deltaproteobacteria bacterium RIFCSPLOWO2_02_FULL_46_8]